MATCWTKRRSSGTCRPVGHRDEPLLRRFDALIKHVRFNEFETVERERNGRSKPQRSNRPGADITSVRLGRQRRRRTLGARTQSRCCGTADASAAVKTFEWNGTAEGREADGNFL